MEAGLPFNRLERLEGSLGTPLPAATQWEIVRDSADRIEPVFEAMIRQAAQGRVLHNDETTMKVLDLATEHKEPTDCDPAQIPDRTGVFTSGIVSVLDGHRIALFFTGHRHAGENLVAVLKQRASPRAEHAEMGLFPPANPYNRATTRIGVICQFAKKAHLISTVLSASYENSRIRATYGREIRLDFI